MSHRISLLVWHLVCCYWFYFHLRSIKLTKKALNYISKLSFYCFSGGFTACDDSEQQVTYTTTTLSYLQNREGLLSFQLCNENVIFHLGILMLYFICCKPKHSTQLCHWDWVSAYILENAVNMVITVHLQSFWMENLLKNPLPSPIRKFQCSVEFVKLRPESILPHKFYFNGLVTKEIEAN